VNRAPVHGCHENEVRLAIFVSPESRNFPRDRDFDGALQYITTLYAKQKRYLSAHDRSVRRKLVNLLFSLYLRLYNIASHCYSGQFIFAHLLPWCQGAERLTRAKPGVTALVIFMKRPSNGKLLFFKTIYLHAFNCFQGFEIARCLKIVYEVLKGD
jgi:hypothetical protein